MLPFPRQSLSGIGIGLPCRSFFCIRNRRYSGACDRAPKPPTIFTKPVVFIPHRSRQRTPFRDSSAAPPDAPFGRGLQSDKPHAQPKSSLMTVHAPKLLTPEEFASLIEIAI